MACGNYYLIHSHHDTNNIDIYHSFIHSFCEHYYHFMQYYLESYLCSLHVCFISFLFNNDTWYNISIIRLQYRGELFDIQAVSFCKI